MGVITSHGSFTSYIKRGFVKKTDAQQHEAEMKAKLSNPYYTPAQGTKGRMSVKDYMVEWLESYGISKKQ